MANTAAIEILERRLTDLERKGNALCEVVNDLRAEDGLPPLPPFGSRSDSGNQRSSAGGHISNIRPDTFYGKKLQTAIREYLGMRRDANLGPAKPREIYDALVSGGFQSEAKDEHIALVGLRALLRKRTNYFHKLPNGTYGLTAWYPNAKQPKPDEAASDEPDKPEDTDGEEQDNDTSAEDEAKVA